MGFLCLLIFYAAHQKYRIASEYQCDPRNAIKRWEKNMKDQSYLFSRNEHVALRLWIFKRSSSVRCVHIERQRQG